MQVTLTQENIELAQEYNKKAGQVFTGFNSSTTTIVNHTFNVGIKNAISEMDKILAKRVNSKKK